MTSTAATIRFLTTAQITRLYRSNVTVALPTQPHMLESAVSSPIAHKHYGETDIFKLAGTLAEKIIRNHAFQDGNKRTALLAADMFLKINGHQLQRAPMGEDKVNQDLRDAHLAVASNEWSAEQLAEYYRKIATPIGEASEEIGQYIADAETH